MNFTAPEVDYAGISPIIALTVGICVVLVAGLVAPRGHRWLSTILTGLTLAATAGLLIWQLGEADKDLVAGALRLDGLAICASLICIAAAALAGRPRDAADGLSGPFRLRPVAGTSAPIAPLRARRRYRFVTYVAPDHRSEDRRRPRGPLPACPDTRTGRIRRFRRRCRRCAAVLAGASAA